MGFIISIIANSIGLYIASIVVPGFEVNPNIPVYYFLLIGFIFNFIFSIVLPIVKLVSFPIIFLTLGLFSFIINIIAFYTLDQFLVGIEFTSFLSIILTSVVISSINMLSDIFLQ